MPTDPALLAQLQSLWQAATPIMPPPASTVVGPPTGFFALDSNAEPSHAPANDRAKSNDFAPKKERPAPLPSAEDRNDLQAEILAGIADGEGNAEHQATWVWRENAALVDGIERDDVPPEHRWWHRATFDQLPYADGRLPCVVADDGDPFDLIGDAEREYLLGRHRFAEPCGFCGGRSCHNPRCVALCDEWQIPMPFGKHRGKPVASLDHDYLAWLLKSGMELTAELRREIERVLKIEQAD